MVVLDIVTDSLRQIGVIGQTKTPSAEQGADAVIRLNDLMASLEADDIRLGWNPKATTATSCVLPDGYVETIKAMLAVKLGGVYGVEVPPVTAGLAASGYDRMLRVAVLENMREQTTDAPVGDRHRRIQDITRLS